MTTLSVLYDPFRAGLIFSFANTGRGRTLHCHKCGLLYLLTESGQLAGFECEWRMPLRRIHCSEHVSPYPWEIWEHRIKEISPASLGRMREANDRSYKDFLANWPSGQYEVGGSLRVKLMYLTQTAEKFCLWFTRTNDVPRPNWTREESWHCGVVIWYSTRTLPLLDFEIKKGWPERRLVAGIEVPFASAAAVYPIQQFQVTCADIK